MVNGEKMSKSLGNFLTVEELLHEVPGEAIRLLLMSTHYRGPLNFTREGLQQTKHALDRWYTALRQLQVIVAETAAPGDGDRVMAAIADDINTPAAIAEIHGQVDKIFAALRAGDPIETLSREKATLLGMGAQLGLLQQDPEEWFRWQPSTAAVVDEREIESQIEARKAARKAKNFKEADRIRDDLKAKGILLEDTPQGTIWRRAG